jgi:hypothetical protein
VQVASCRVALAGDLHNVTVKPAVSPAEAVILRALHGAGAVTAIKVIQTGKVSHKAERNRLRGIYGKKRVDALFPGAVASLPETFEEIEEAELETELPDEDEGFGRTPHVLDLMKAAAKDMADAPRGEGAASLADVFAGGADDAAGALGIRGEDAGGSDEE